MDRLLNENEIKDIAGMGDDVWELTDTQLKNILQSQTEKDDKEWIEWFEAHYSRVVNDTMTIDIKLWQERKRRMGEKNG